MKITVQKIGGIWHGYVEGHPEVDERALTAEIAERKVRTVLDRLREAETSPPSDRSPRSKRDELGEVQKLSSLVANKDIVEDALRRVDL